MVLKACETIPFDITVLEGIRTVARQKELVASGASKTMNSKHLTGDAVDLAPYPIDWKKPELFREISKHMFAAATELKTPIVWGGSWSSSPAAKDAKFFDGPHYQLN